MIEKIHLKKNKKAVSLVVSYVILVSIVLGLSITVYSILKTEANRVKPVTDCKDGTSIIFLGNISQPNKFIIKIKNNGLFNISGVIVHYSKNENKHPVNLLKLNPNEEGYDPGFGEGYYLFSKPLAPGDKKEDITYQENDISEIKRIQIQPFIKDENNKLIVCSEAIINTKI